MTAKCARRGCEPRSAAFSCRCALLRPWETKAGPPFVLCCHESRCPPPEPSCPIQVCLPRCATISPIRIFFPFRVLFPRYYFILSVHPPPLVRTCSSSTTISARRSSLFLPQLTSSPLIFVDNISSVRALLTRRDAQQAPRQRAGVGHALRHSKVFSFVSDCSATPGCCYC